MATGLYGEGFRRILTEGFNSMTPTIKLMGTNGVIYAYNRAHVFYDNNANNNTDPSFCETNATNHVAKSASESVIYDISQLRIEIAVADLVWTALGGTINDTIDAAIMYDNAGSETTSPLLVYFDNVDVTTNGGDATLNFDNIDGNIRISI